MATFGIDLGTTYSCIAHVDKTGRPVVLKSADGEETTPSVVYFESPEHVVVGAQAKASAVLSPDLVAELIKRKMGQDVHYSFHGQDHTPESISALILRELARSAAERTGEVVHDVVITVPAYFGLLEREATRKAGQIAGLNVLDVLAEPVAAALDYQAFDDEAAAGVRHIFVYDLGGGTFDTTVIRVSGNEIQVICTDGNHQLGGADWDSAIIDFLLRSFTDQYPQLDPSGDEQFMQELSISAEQLKKSLSAATARKQVLRFDGSAMQVELTRDHLDELTSELAERTMEITSRTIATAREKGIDQFDDVLLVGGMTITPVIKEMLKERFGMEARQREPHVAVARGAALFALMQQVKVVDGETPGSGPSKAEEMAERLNVPVEQIESMAAMRVATVVPRAFGLNVVDPKDPLARIDPSRARHYIEHLLTANTALPADTGPQQFATVSRNQRQVRLEVWEQAGSTASRELAHNSHIGEGLLQGLPDGPPGTPFDVEFHMTETGLLKVHAFEPVSKQEVDFEIQIGHLDAAEVEEATDAVAGYEVSG